MNRDRLIDTGKDRLYFVLFTFLMAFAGILYLLGVLGSDSSTPILSYVEYAGLAAGGVVILGSFALPNKLYVLRAQVVGLVIQGLAALALGTSIIVQEGPLLGLYGGVFCAVTGFLHGSRVVQLVREIAKVPSKRRLAEHIDIPAGPDPMLGTLLFLEKKTDVLEQQLNDAIAQLEAYLAKKK